jgi:transposase
MERLHMNYLHDLIYRLRAGESERRIAKDLNISRPTVHKYRLWAEAQGFLRPGCALPDQATLLAALGSVLQPPPMISTLEPHRATVEQLLEQGVEMTAIWQRLQENHDYQGSYSSVRRFVHHLRPSEAEAFVRVHSAPGEEMQVDPSAGSGQAFGYVGQLYDPGSGRLRPAYAFVATLCYSRHQYAELVFDQKVPTWLALHRRAFESFGGVPRRVVPDNLKAAVLRALVHDPVLGEAYRRLALHYGFLISPTVPHTPRHKGKVESGVHYVQRNFMACLPASQQAGAGRPGKCLWTATPPTPGSRFGCATWPGSEITAPPTSLLCACSPTTSKQPCSLLPTTPFTLRQIKPVKVHPDCHVVLEGSYYSVPYSYIGQTLDAYVSEQIVELYSGVDLVATHLRSTQPGQWQTRLEDYPPDKAAYLIQTPVYCRQAAIQIGPAVTQVVETLLAERPLDRLRAVQAILRLADTVGPQRLEAACARLPAQAGALHYGDVRYRRIKQILNAALDRDPLPDQPTLPVGPLPSFAFARTSADFFPDAEARPC